MEQADGSEEEGERCPQPTGGPSTQSMNQETTPRVSVQNRVDEFSEKRTRHEIATEDGDRRSLLREEVAPYRQVDMHA